MVRIWAVAAALMLAWTTAASAAETGFLNRSVRVAGADYAYQVYVPRTYRAGQRLPIMLALHGAGERGSDGLLQTEVGVGSALRRHADRYNAIVVLPQVPLDQSWQGVAGDVAMAALDRSAREFRTDPKRVYLGGMSLGGNGTWYLAYKNPDRFAAIVVVCGFVDPVRTFPAFTPAGVDPAPAIAARVARLPVYVVHGDADTVVPVEQSRKMVAALRAAGADVTYVELPGVGHNAWDPAFRSPELTGWLFSKRKP